MVEYLYGDRWNARTQEPAGAISESEAHARFKGSVPEPRDWFTVARPEGEGGRYATLEVFPRGEFIRATHLDPAGSATAVFDFGEKDGELFWENVFEYQYPDDGKFHLRGDALVIEQTRFSRGGTVSISTDIRSLDGVDVREFRDVDVSTHWLPLPDFGEWDEFMRLDRE